MLPCRLSFCGITDKGASDLASSLSSNPAHLRQLDLSYNYLQQESGSKLNSLRQDNPLCKLQRLRLVEVCQRLVVVCYCPMSFPVLNIWSDHLTIFTKKSIMSKGECVD